jgi:hypothetical protein
MQKESISYAGDSPAKTLLSLGTDPALAEHGQDCGGKCTASSENTNLVGSLLRTFLLSELKELTQYSFHWNRKDTPQNRTWWVLTPLEPLTKENGCGYWPTATVQDGENDAGPSQFRRNSLPLNAAVHVSSPVYGEEIKKHSRLPGLQLNSKWVAQFMGYQAEWLS